MSNFEINQLDHVAIRVNDLAVSVTWYESVLGLKKHQTEQWGDFPIFMMAGKTGVALFPANIADGHGNGPSVIDHFAFNVNQENFEKAKIHFEEKGVAYNFQDHHYFHSLYIKDPDNHTVELTTLVVAESAFYH